MKPSLSQAAAAALAVLAAAPVPSLVGAFVPPSFRSSGAAAPSATELRISSWGPEGPPHRQKAEQLVDPAKKISAYLQPPEPVAARDNLEGTCLVSGWVRSKERTDQFVFDCLNHQESAFRFEKIVAFVDDEKFAKKRLLGRHARYTGLLDKLAFAQAEEAGALPTADQLDGVRHWVAAVGDDLGLVGAIGDLARAAPTVENVAILLTGASTATAEAATEAVKGLSEGMDGKKKAYTVVAVGELTDTPEGAVPYALADLGSAPNGTLAETEAFSRDESIRLVTECLGLESGRNRALCFREVRDVNATEYRLVKGLREGGYSRPQEIENMITDGPEAYLQACEDFKTKEPKRTQFDEWMLEEEEKLKEEQKKNIKRKDEDREAAREKEVDDIAREWAKREFFRKGMAGEIIDMTEEEYIESIMDRAKFEGDIRWRQINGLQTDEETELEDFKSQQEKKKQAMLERAKASLSELLDDETVSAGKGGDDDDE